MPTPKTIHQSLRRVRPNTACSSSLPFTSPLVSSSKPKAKRRAHLQTRSHGLHTHSPAQYNSNILSQGQFFDSPPPPLRGGSLTPKGRLSSEHGGSTQSNPSPNQHTPNGHPNGGGNGPPVPLAFAPSNPLGTQLQSYGVLGLGGSSPPKHDTHVQSGKAVHEHEHEGQGVGSRRRGKRPQLKWKLDVAGYGIAKNCRGPVSGAGQCAGRSMHTNASTSSFQYDPPPVDYEKELELAVQVGEDAYFVRDNAMGVADGVGGWNKGKGWDPSLPTPSALFARRLMHYCSAELDDFASPSSPPSVSFSPSTTNNVSSITPPSLPTSKTSRPLYSLDTHLKPRTGADLAISADTPSVSLPSVPSHPHSCIQEPEPKRTEIEEEEEFSEADLDEYSHLSEEELQALLDEFNKYSEEDLERCTEEELEGYLNEELEELAEGIDVLRMLERAYERSVREHVVPSVKALSGSKDPGKEIEEPKREPLLSGSSTALVAILDAPPFEPSLLTPVLADKRDMEKRGSIMDILTSSAHPPLNGLWVDKLAEVSGHASSPSTASPDPPHSPDRHRKGTSLGYQEDDAVNLSVPHDGRVGNYAAGSVHPALFYPAGEFSAGGPQISTRVNAEGVTGELAQMPCDAVLRIAHIGDCMGMLVRGGEVVWRSEEMWWDFNTPLQLGPSTHSSNIIPGSKSTEPPRGVTPLTIGHSVTLPVLQGDIVILGSDGVGDNLWDEDVKEEVGRFINAYPGIAQCGRTGINAGDGAAATLESKNFARMLAEALCSRARRVSERRGGDPDEGEVPFGRRAREAGKRFKGGKIDDISVVVAVIAPVDPAEIANPKTRSRSSSGASRV